jgi:predicted NBD/HSP70 family sugar kinase
MSLLEEFEKNTKSTIVKKQVIAFYIQNGFATLAELSKQLNLSIPTVTKIVEEMTEQGLIVERGKLETAGGRHPSLYGLNPDSCYFGGVDIKNNSISIGVVDFTGQMVTQSPDIPYDYENTPAALDDLCHTINKFFNSLEVPRDKIAMINVNISGRVNPMTGHSYSRYNFDEQPLSDILSKKLRARVCIENDTRAMALGEYLSDNNHEDRNLLFINLSWGLGLGAVIEGKIVTGKSGFAGEFGHMVTCDNEVICHCGKKGCLETEASGSALVRKMTERLKGGANSIIADRYAKNGKITLEDALDAVRREDLLAIEVIEEMGKTLGRWLAGMINVFNPEKVIIGGVLAETGDYLLQPIRTAVRLYSLNLVSQDTKIMLSRHGNDGGLVGACLIARNRLFGTCGCNA